MIAEIENSRVFTENLRKYNDETIKLTARQTIYSYTKRSIDVLIALFGLAVMIIPFLAVAVFIKSDSKGPVLYKQNRVGKQGKLFKIYKFRTMTVKKESDSSNSVTRVGRILRKTSIDELPQLINILKGNMSFVGPRPLVPEEGEIHNLRMKNGVYNVTPGLTGLAQISGRDIITVEQKVRLDTEYVKHYGFLSDVMLVLKTIPKAFAGTDVVEGTLNICSKTPINTTLL